MFVRPEEVIKKIGIEPGMVVADFGAGSGHYSIAAAKIVRNTGKVYSVDIQKELLAAIKSAAALNNLSNVEIVWSDLEIPEGSRLADNSADAVIISNILFQVNDKEAVLKEASRILKNDGRIAVIEWEKKRGKWVRRWKSAYPKKNALKFLRMRILNWQKNLPREKIITDYYLKKYN